jgi:acyl-CoA dehydrogenase/long-chain-acyl-CoA dehydrogenase
MLRREIYDERHEEFRATVRKFFTEEVAPDYPGWEEQGYPPREFWLRAGELGILGIGVPAEYGGLEGSTFKHSAVVTEEAQRANIALGIRVQTDVCMPYFLEYTNEEQKQRWVPDLASGRAVGALGMSEPGVGSDMKAMATRAVRDGDHYVVNGAKTFISNGMSADLVVIAAKTDPAAGRNGLSLIVAETKSEGFEVGRKLDKLGLRTQDLAELAFTDMVVPAENLLGEENRGFDYLTNNLAQERLSIAVSAQAAAVATLERTTRHVQEHGNGLAKEQGTKFELAACAAEIAAGQNLVDTAVDAHDARELSVADAASVKLFCTELQGRVADRCVQLLGPEAYSRTSPAGGAFADARVTRIYGGSSEIMKVIVSKDLGL